MKNLIKLVKKIVLGALLLYSYNLIAVSFSMTIPINIFTVMIAAFLDIPGMVLLTLASIIVF
jgi:SigmaK-factor processing regulatory protein BofA.